MLRVFVAAVIVGDVCAIRVDRRRERIQRLRDRDLTSYSLQRATDSTLDGVCTGTNWLTLGEGLTPHPIVTDDTGTAHAGLWRDLSAVAPGTTFDIHFRLIENNTTPVHVVLQSDCYRFVVRN